MLRAKGIDFQAHNLPDEKLSAKEAAAFLGVSENRVFKTIVLLDERSAQSFLALVPGDKTIDLKAVGQLLSSKRIKVVSQSQAEKLTGLKTGGISALALLNKKFKVILDEKALSQGNIFVSGGQRGLNISIKVLDLIQLCSATVGKISKIKKTPKRQGTSYKIIRKCTMDRRLLC